MWSRFAIVINWNLEQEREKGKPAVGLASGSWRLQMCGEKKENGKGRQIKGICEGEQWLLKKEKLIE